MTTFDQQRQQINHQTNISGDEVQGDKVIGDKVVGNKITNIYQQATPQQIADQERTAALEQLDQLPLDHVPSLSQLPPGSWLPFDSNPHFVGREAELMALAQQLKGADGVAAISQAAVATGLGGIGKSQLAIAFAHRYGNYFKGGVHWVSMADPNAVPAEIARCGIQMYPDNPDFANQKLERQVIQVLAQWQNELPRLLIFDNCEESTLLDQWRPKQGGCRILITSRRAEWGSARGLYALPLSTLPRDQSVALLLKFRPDLTSGEERLDQIAQALGDHPLALHLAGSYLETYRHDIELADYLAELQRPDFLVHESLQTDAADYSPTDHDRHVGRTFALSTQRLDPNNPTDQLACKLLARTACFAPSEPIPRDLLFATLRDGPTPVERSKALRRLVNLGLVEGDKTENLTIHRLICYFVYSLDLDIEATNNVETTLICKADVINKTGIPGLLLPWQPHFRHITDQALLRQDEWGALLCNQLGSHLIAIGAYGEAHPYFNQALFINQEMQGKKHPDTATSLNNLGELHYNMGTYEEALLYHEKALSIRQEVLGKKHPATAGSLNNLGALYRVMGDYKKARSCYEAALPINEEVLGAMHSNTARNLNNLGLLLSSMGAHEEARDYQKRALFIWREVLGEKHPDTAICLNNLGLLYNNMGAYEDARYCYEKALSIQQEVLGDKHPDTAQSLNNLGGLYKAIGEHKKARSYYEEALSVRREVLGEKHPDTAQSLNNLGGLLSLTGAYEEARSYLEAALSIHRQMCGWMHPTTAISLSNLGFWLTSMNAYEEALPYLEAALPTLEEMLGPEHPNTVTVRGNLERLLAKMADEGMTR